MATPEGRVKGWLDAMLKAENVWYFSPQAGPYGGSGVPDRVAIVCGLFVGIEVKADAKCKMTARQLRCAEQIRNALGYHFLVYDKETVEHVRAFIQHVRLSSPGQESGSGVNTKPRRRAGSNPIGTPSQGQPSAGPSPTGRNSSTAQFGVPDTGTHPLLLSVPGSVQADGSPASHVGLPN